MKRGYRIEVKERARQAGKEVQREREREREGEGGRLRDPSFFKLRAKGGITTRSDALSPESCSPIGSRPHLSSLLGPEAVSFAHPARRGREPCTELPGRVMATG